MATTRPPGGSGGTPRATIGFDYSQLRNAPNVAREVGRAVARELQNAFKLAQGEQKILLEQTRQATSAVKSQQAQITATTKAESSIRMTTARAEAEAQRQAQRLAIATGIEEQKRLTAQVKAEIRERERANRQSQASAGAFGRGAASFAGAAFAGPIGGLVGAIGSGSPALAAGLAVSEGARRAIEATQVATAYGRQEIAARNLAGSQGKLNTLMLAFTRATGGAVDDVARLENVTSLLAQGFAKSAPQMEEFLRGVRGASIATGKPQDFIIERAQFEMLNQTGQRLNEIGLGMAEVRQRADELRASNENLSREQAYQQAVIQKLNEKYGNLTKSTEGQATGTERVSVAAKNLTLVIGQILGPTVNAVGAQFSTYLEGWVAGLKLVQMGAEQTAKVLQQLGVLPMPSTSNIAARNSLVGRGGGITLPPERFRGGVMIGEEHQALINQRQESLSGIDRDSVRQQNEIVREGASQRAAIIRDFEKGVAREAQDFARQRLNAEIQFNMSILDIAQDSARQRLKWEADLARSIAKTQEDSAERVADARKDTAKRLAELDKDFKKDQERREKDYRDDMLSAAGRLDAIALLELRKDRAKALQEAKESHEEQRADLQEQLKERLDEEARSLEKSIRQQREAHQRQLEEQAENDRLRIEEMRAAFEDQKAQEDIERGIMIQRRADDHAARLVEFDAQQADRIQQIKDQAQEQRDEIDKQFEKDMDAAGIRTKAYEERQKALEKIATDSFDRWWAHVNNEISGRVQGPSQRLPLPRLNPNSPPVTGSSFIMPQSSSAATGTGGRSVSFSGNINISILGGTNMGANELRPLIREELLFALEEAGGR